MLSWTLRRPSARLERRIFAAAPAAMEALPPLRLNWLAPALAALVLMGVLVNERCGPALSAAGNSGPLVALILSNQSAAAYLPGSIQAERNNLPADTFVSPSARGASARLSAISPAKAND